MNGKDRSPRVRCLPGVVLMIMVFLVATGCGGGGDGGDSRTPRDGEDSAPSKTEGGALVVEDPKKLSGDPAPAEFLPPGFVLPKGATVIRGNGDYKPETGQFYLRIDAPLERVMDFFEREYPKRGWKEISASTFNRDGSKGFDLLYGKDDSRYNAGFTAEERKGEVLVQVYYNDQSKS